MKKVSVLGKLLGHRVSPKDKSIIGMVVQIMQDYSFDGPAENAYIYIDTVDKKAPRARYISWINLFDIENAAKCEPGCWSLVEPSTKFNQSIEWIPYGWNESIPSIVDIN